MNKIDYKKVFKEYYGATREPALVHVAPMQFLMYDGRGDPNTEPAFQRGVEALFTLAYTLKFMLKKGPMALDFAVMPLEGLWWSDDPAHFTQDRSAWQWRLMLMQPPVVSAEMVAEAAAQARAKKRAAGLDEVRFELFDEGKAVQVLHVGPFAEEGPTIERLHHFAADQGWTLTGNHHEIYLSDMRRGAPEKWKTILRHPVVLKG